MYCVILIRTVLCSMASYSRHTGILIITCCYVIWLVCLICTGEAYQCYTADSSAQAFPQLQIIFDSGLYVAVQHIIPAC